MKRLLVAGLGLIGARHAAAVQAHPGCVLAGVIDPDPARRQGVEAPGFARLEEVDVAADGIILATPTGLHAEHAAYCAARGWDMLIEKPVADSLADADRIVEAIARADVAALVGHHRRHHPRVAALREALDGDRIGQPVLANLIWAVRKPDAYFEDNWRSGSGGSPVLINLVHDLDLLRFLLGEVEAVTGLGAAPIRGTERVESGGAVIRFATGCVATLAFADTAPAPWGFEAGTGENPNIAATGQNCLWIAGTAGGIAFPSLTSWSGAADWSEAPRPEPLDAEDDAPLTRQLDHFLAVIGRRERPLIDVADARRTLDLTLRVAASVSPPEERRLHAAQ